jgi:hypothetical protein
MSSQKKDDPNNMSEKKMRVVRIEIPTINGHE